MNGNLNPLAEALVFVHGTFAESEAARHALMSERSGDMEIAEAWREVQRAVRRLTRDQHRRAA
jgi:hypothetical protein